MAKERPDIIPAPSTSALEGDASTHDQKTEKVVDGESSVEKSSSTPKSKVSKFQKKGESDEDALKRAQRIIREYEFRVNGGVASTDKQRKEHEKAKTYLSFVEGQKGNNSGARVGGVPFGVGLGLGDQVKKIVEQNGHTIPEAPSKSKDSEKTEKEKINEMRVRAAKHVDAVWNRISAQERDQIDNQRAESFEQEKRERQIQQVAAANAKKDTKGAVSKVSIEIPDNLKTKEEQVTFLEKKLEEVDDLVNTQGYIPVKKRNEYVAQRDLIKVKLTELKGQPALAGAKPESIEVKPLSRVRASKIATGQGTGSSGNVVPGAGASPESAPAQAAPESDFFTKYTKQKANLGETTPRVEKTKKFEGEKDYFSQMNEAMGRAGNADGQSENEAISHGNDERNGGWVTDGTYGAEDWEETKKTMAAWARGESPRKKEKDTAPQADQSESVVAEDDRQNNPVEAQENSPEAQKVEPQTQKVEQNPGVQGDQEGQTQSQGKKPEESAGLLGYLWGMVHRGALRVVGSPRALRETVRRAQYGVLGDRMALVLNQWKIALGKRSSFMPGSFKQLEVKREKLEREMDELSKEAHQVEEQRNKRDKGGFFEKSLSRLDQTRLERLSIQYDKTKQEKNEVDTKMLAIHHKVGKYQEASRKTIGSVTERIQSKLKPINERFVTMEEDEKKLLSNIKERKVAIANLRNEIILMKERLKGLSGETKKMHKKAIAERDSFVSDQEGILQSDEGVLNKLQEDIKNLKGKKDVWDTFLKEFDVQYRKIKDSVPSVDNVLVDAVTTNSRLIREKQ